ncbi:MAG: isochorismatase family cysteine hydrolase [Candidatus Acidiferrales bacterium]
MSSHKKVLWQVDAQVDFMLPGGALYVPGAENIIPNIKRLVDAAQRTHTPLISSADAHPPNDPEFKQFPPHCLKGTRGADLVAQARAAKVLTIPNENSFAVPADIAQYDQVLLEKQTFDVFDNVHTAEILDKLDPHADFYLFGVVTEYCVRAAAKGLAKRGRKVHLVSDAIETLKEEDSKRAMEELGGLGAKTITTAAVVAALH